MPSVYYINNQDDSFKNILMNGKNKDGTRTTVGQAGCVVCCIAMAILYRSGNGSATNTDKADLVKSVIANCTEADSNSASWNSSIKYAWNNKTYNIKAGDKTQPTSYPFMREYPPHSVLQISSTAVEDPSSTTVTTVTQANSDYGTINKYWTITQA